MNNKTVLLVLLIVLVVGILVLLLPNTYKNSAKPGQLNVTTPPNQAEQQPGTPTVKKNTITVSTSGFTPETITIKTGEQVTWTNKSGKAVSLNSAAHPIHLDYPALNLGEFGNDRSVQLKFEKAGMYEYHNHLIPGQTGTVIVQ